MTSLPAIVAGSARRFVHGAAGCELVEPVSTAQKKFYWRPARRPIFVLRHDAKLSHCGV